MPFIPKLPVASVVSDYDSGSYLGALCSSSRWQVDAEFVPINNSSS